MANADGSFLSERIDAAAWPLAVGDVLVIAALITVGTVKHQGASVVTADPLYVAGTVAPFLVGWLLIAPLVGAYSPGAAESAKSAVPLGVRAWVGAELVGLVLRATPFFRGGLSDPVSSVIFAVVIFVVVGVGLSVWRWLFFRIR